MGTDVKKDPQQRHRLDCFLVIFCCCFVILCSCVPVVLSSCGFSSSHQMLTSREKRHKSVLPRQQSKTHKNWYVNRWSINVSVCVLLFAQQENICIDMFLFLLKCLHPHMHRLTASGTFKRWARYLLLRSVAWDDVCVVYQSFSSLPFSSSSVFISPS